MILGPRAVTVRSAARNPAVACRCSTPAAAPVGSGFKPAFEGVSAATNDRNPRPENVEGNFYVDHTCIDCDTCRAMAPETFSRVGPQSAVHQQPTDPEARVAAMQALLSCPTFSIHARERSAEELKAAQQGLPRPVPGTSNIYANGWRSIHSIACESYLITRPQGNILVDTPRFNPVLAKKLQGLGGVKYIFLTHKDDVGEHAAWAKHFSATRILHTEEVQETTKDVEIKLEGVGPWRLPDGGDDVELIFTPGHAPAHVCLLYKPEKALFSGDHLSGAYRPGDLYYEPGQDLFVFKEFNWHSFPQQLQSVQKLLEYDWLHVLPGHGRPTHLRDAAHRLQAVSNLLQLHGYTEPAASNALAAAQLEA